MGYNFDEFFQRFLKLFKQLINDPKSDHPLKHILTNEDIDRLAENPPSREDISKFMQYLFGDPNFNPFAVNNPYLRKTPPPPPSKKPRHRGKGPQKERLDANLIIDTFEFGNEVHVLVGTHRTDLEFKTGVKKGTPTDIALIIRDKRGLTIQVVKLPPTIDRKTKRVSYRNGTYEIIYQKKS
ncbi:MAG: hypothetical protein ACFFD2_06785 [Promethearchaeota archaeon]